MHVCRSCKVHVKGSSSSSDSENDEAAAGAASEADVCCSVCFGILTEDHNYNDDNVEGSFRSSLLEALRKAVEPYGGRCKSNRISFETNPPTIIPPGDLLYRYHLAATTTTNSTTPSDYESVSVAKFGNILKQEARNLLTECLKELECDDDDDEQNAAGAPYPSHVIDEEQGFLCFFVIVTPKKTVVPRPYDLIPKQSNSDGRRGRNKRRKCFDFQSQGGDPRKNLEQRLEDNEIEYWSMNQAISDADASLFRKKESRHKQEILAEKLPLQPLDFHVAVWRRPFYVRGMYTKSRRDVSQSPFFVTGAETKGERQKKGVTSVEEQILPSITKYCGGISTLNNNPADEHQVVFGMAKFHASGREDINVRMLLPDPSILKEIQTSKKEKEDDSTIITARPFVCEITDSLRMPTMENLVDMVREINHTKINGNSDKNNGAGGESLIDIPNPINEDPRWFGRNPLGVGISSHFVFAPSLSFGLLQAETEDKVKYYGCLCWSAQSFESVQALEEKLLPHFPLEIQQKTPLRVLHRRSNAIRLRHILFCKVTRIDEHHFRLNISTDAGTYVKEFVHGDLGRTQPNVSSLLGCKTDILELDCEGMEMPK